MPPCPVTADLNRHLDQRDAAERRDMRIEARRDEIVQTMLELERAFVERPLTTDVYDLNEDVCEKVIEENSEIVAAVIRLMLQANYLDSRRIKSQAEADYAERLFELQQIAHQKLLDVCEKIAKKEIDNGR